jgi:DNA polymerase-3 subunit beta
LEQLNIEGKRSGSGLVAHKAILVNALSRALADRVVLMDLTIGRKGLLGYFKALGGSNIIKIVPDGSASGSQANGDKRLKVICGANTGTLADSQWIGEKTPMTTCDVRVSPKNSVKPNIGAGELAEALNRVLPFTAKDDNRPVLQCVNFTAKEGKLTLVSADGFRLAVVNLDYDDGEGQALINRRDLAGIANALRKARRARISFDTTTHIHALTLDTELIRYKWVSVEGAFPDYEKLIPAEFHTFAHFDTVEAIRAVNSLKVLSDSKAYPVDLTISEGKIVMANPDDKGQAELSADTEGEGKVRVDGSYLASVLKACGGMVDFKLTTPISPMLFASDGYQVVVMPMMTAEAKEAVKETGQAETAKPTEEKESKPAEPKAETRGEPVETKPKKVKHSREKVPVTA